MPSTQIWTHVISVGEEDGWHFCSGWIRGVNNKFPINLDRQVSVYDATGMFKDNLYKMGSDQ